MMAPYGPCAAMLGNGASVWLVAVDILRILRFRPLVVVMVVESFYCSVEGWAIWVEGMSLASVGFLKRQFWGTGLRFGKRHFCRPLKSTPLTTHIV